MIQIRLVLQAVVKIMNTNPAQLKVFAEVLTTLNLLLGVNE
jgi:hypothetical protein